MRLIGPYEASSGDAMYKCISPINGWTEKLNTDEYNVQPKKSKLGL